MEAGLLHLLRSKSKNHVNEIFLAVAKARNGALPAKFFPTLLEILPGITESQAQEVSFEIAAHTIAQALSFSAIICAVSVTLQLVESVKTLIGRSLKAGPSANLFDANFHANLRSLLLQILEAHHEKWLAAEPQVEAKPEPKPEPKAGPKAEPKVQAQPQAQPKAEPRAQPQAPKAEAKLQRSDSARSESEAKPAPRAQPAPAEAKPREVVRAPVKKAEPKLKPKRQAKEGGISLPKLLDVDWRIDIKTASESMSRMAVPTVLVGLKTEGVAKSVDQAPQEQNIVFELGMADLETMLDGLRFVQVQLQSLGQ
jgi:hypothetical protein